MMSKHLCLALLALFSTAAWAAEFNVDGRKVRFIERFDGRLMVSANCLNARGEIDCLARTKALEGSLAGIAPKGGAQPGSEICARLGGKRVLGLDSKRNENFFCEFSDRSMIDLGSLEYYADAMDAVRAKKRR